MTFFACLSVGGRNEAMKLQSPVVLAGSSTAPPPVVPYGPDMAPLTEFPPVCRSCVCHVRPELILAKEIQPHPLGARAEGTQHG